MFLQKLRKNQGTFKHYVWKILATVHPGAHISTRAMQIMDELLVDIFNRIARQAGILARLNRCSTISSREVHSAVKLVFEGKLREHAVNEGSKAVTTFKANK